MRFLVTGSSGFIGQHLVQLLIQNEYEVEGIDIKVPPVELEGFRHWKCDILDRESLKQIFLDTSPQVVIHLAARTDLDEKDDLSGYAANIDGVESLIQAIQASPSIERCIFTSSQLVCRLGYVPISDDDYCPYTLYGESKVLTEKIVRRQTGGGRTWCLVRPTTVWGPNMNPHYQRFFNLVASGRYVHIGSSRLLKTYGYVGNVAYQYLKLVRATSEQINAKLFYLADYEPLSLRDWANALQHEMGARRICTVPVTAARIATGVGDLINSIGFKKFPFNSFRLNNVLTEYRYDMRATKALCGPLPYSMEDGVSATIAWYKNGITHASEE